MSSDELTTALSGVGVSGTIIVLVIAIWKIVAGFNHTRVRSHCCGKVAEVGIDVETGTPKEGHTDTK